MMAFKKNMVCSIKANGKILREIDNTVRLPFNSEYSILLKNLENRDALVDIEIDGTKVFSNLILRSNQTIELERYENRSNKFKFIEKTERISDFRGDKIDDGFIRISFRYTKEIEKSAYGWTYRCAEFPRGYLDGVGYPDPERTIYYGDVTANNYVYHGQNSSISTNNTICSFSSNASEPLTKGVLRSRSIDGITVPGSKSKQTFTTANIGTLEDTVNVIVIHLQGKTEEAKQIQKAVTVKEKIECPTCGKKNKSSFKYCSTCGTALF